MTWHTSWTAIEFYHINYIRDSGPTYRHVPILVYLALGGATIVTFLVMEFEIKAVVRGIRCRHFRAYQMVAVLVRLFVHLLYSLVWPRPCECLKLCGLEARGGGQMAEALQIDVVELYFYFMFLVENWRVIIFLLLVQFSKFWHLLRDFFFNDECILWSNLLAQRRRLKLLILIW